MNSLVKLQTFRSWWASVIEMFTLRPESKLQMVVVGVSLDGRFGTSI